MPRLVGVDFVKDDGSTNHSESHPDRQKAVNPDAPTHGLPQRRS
jgi:hypothetical protein